MKTVNETIERFKTRNGGLMTRMMLNEVELQYIEMAQGGDGTVAMCGEIREKYYPMQPDSFFQKVCDGMEWDWRTASAAAVAEDWRQPHEVM